jgi:diacylglycerol kinase family enzyme
VHALVAGLARRHAAGERLDVAPTWRIAENRWAACRHGLDARLADLCTGEPRPARERLGALLDSLEPVADRLRCAAELDAARRLVERNGAVRQRAVAAERGLPFVVVPYGTRNHFARDLGLDRDDPLAALEAFRGEERRIDLGRAGERRFLNNVSLGLYAALVHRREHHRRRREVFAGVRALWLSVRGRPDVWATVDGEPMRARVLVVANNAYDLRLFSIGERERLDEGRLHLYAARGVLPSDWDERSGASFRVEAPGPLRAAIDGEPVELEPPLELAIEPGALGVLLPRAQD